MDACNYAMEGWEWESIFASSFLEQEAGVIPWQSTFREPEPTNTGTEATAPHNASDSRFNSNLASVPLTKTTPHSAVLTKPRDGKASNSTPAFSSNAAITSDGSSDYNQDTSSITHHLLSEGLPNDPEPAVATKKKKKKRDPRLECPNFLAGRIPCSCPEEDELDNEAQDIVKKRSKVGGRCQVPSCGGNISHLKGYHQRHRVCLGCATSPQVLLKDQPHRYCQQCGKFHRLSDFDEGKRSCRRKLERHNNRRRRRQPLDEDEEPQDLGAPLFEVEKENATIGDSSTQAGLDLRNLVIDDRPANNDLSTSALRLPINCDKNGEQPWLTTLMDDVTRGVEKETGNLTDLHMPKRELPSAAHLPTGTRRYAKYTSPCPTGRVSFKLYDWNPADFPRRLRQQIFEWLANMPVELEGYIRSGCIIMTFFIAAPQSMWDKIIDEWVEHIQKLLLWSGPKLWGTSQLLTPVYEKSVYVRDGEVTHADHHEKRLAPYVVDLYPLSLQAGCHCHIYLSGFNFDGARFLVSFGECYLECSDCEPVNYHHVRLQRVWKVKDNLEFWRVTVFLPDSQKVGPAYLEVDNGHGVSNFMPLLVADKDVCEEINAFGFGCLPLAAVCSNIRSTPRVLKYLKPNSAMDVLMDLGWVFRYTNKHAAINIAEVSDAFMERLQRLLTYCSEHGWHIAAQRLVQPVLSSGVVQYMSFISGGRRYWNVIAPLQQYGWHIAAQRLVQPVLSSGIVQYMSFISGGRRYWNVLMVAEDIPHFFSAFNLKVKLSNSFAPKAATLTEVDSSYAVGLSSQHKALSEATSTDAKLRQLWVAVMYSDQVVATWAKEWTVVNSPMLEEKILILEDGWKLKIGGWLESLKWIRMRAINSVRPALSSGNNGVCQIIATAVCILTVCTELASSCSIRTRLERSPCQ